MKNCASRLAPFLLLPNNGARLSRLVLSILFGAAMLVVILWNEAHAQSARIVALGASNTAGFGVGKGAAWPARHLRGPCEAGREGSSRSANRARKVNGLCPVHDPRMA